jgi:lipooligosaccharide transport system ATP-binding protein
MIIDHGRIVAQGSPRELIEAHVTLEVLEVRFALDVKEAAGAKLRTSELGGDGADAGPRVEIPTPGRGWRYCRTECWSIWPPAG